MDDRMVCTGAWKAITAHMTSIWNAPEMDLVVHHGMTDQNKGKAYGTVLQIHMY